MKIVVENIVDGPDVAPKLKIMVFSKEESTDPIATLTPNIVVSRQLWHDVGECLQYFDANSDPL